MLLGGMVICGLKPGPLLFQTNPDFVWAIMAALFLTNFILLIMNLPLVPIFAYALRIPYSLLYPFIIVICVIGSYNIFSDAASVGIMFLFGIIGYFMKKCEIPGAPLIIALVLGKMLENSLYQALNLSYGDITTFVRRPISATLLGIAVISTILVAFKAIRTKREMLDGNE